MKARKKKINQLIFISKQNDRENKNKKQEEFESKIVKKKKTI